MVEQIQGFTFYDISAEDMSEEYPELRSFILAAHDELRSEVENDGLEIPAPQLELGVDNVLFVCDIPTITPDKEQKLSEILNKILRKVLGETPYRLVIPFNAEGTSSYGMANVYFDDKEQAKTAKGLLQGVKFNPKHTFKVLSFSEAAALETLPEAFEPPELPTAESLKHWNLDARDQLLIRNRSAIKVHYNDHCAEQTEEFSELTGVDPELEFHWSPQGTYLYSVCDDGLVIRGGDTLDILYTLPHPWAMHGLISKTEKYAISHSYNKGQDTEVYTVWNILTKEDLRSFVSQGSSWGKFQWSYDDQFVARVVPNKVSMYDSSTMQMLQDSMGNKKSLDIPNISDIAWSPTENLLACIIEAEAQVPAQIRLYKIPSRDMVSSMTVRNLNHCVLHWQPSGKHLAAVIDTTTKTGTVTKGGQVSIFYTGKNAGNVASEAIQMPSKKGCMQFGWEGYGNHCAIISKSGASYNLTVYLATDGCRLLSTVQTEGNQVKWAPRGGSLITIMGNTIEFFRIKKEQLVHVTSQTVNQCNQIEWDSTGRFLLTAQVMSQFHRGATSGRWHGFNVFNCQGSYLYQVKIDDLIQLEWRPRTQALMSQQQMDEVAKPANVRKLTQRYREEDKEREREKIEHEEEVHQTRMARFNAIKEQRQKKLADIGWVSAYTTSETERYEIEVDVKVPIKH